MTQAVIFDFDGIIVDSEPFHYRAFKEAMGADGERFTWDDYLNHMVGFDDRDLFRHAYALLNRPMDERAMSRCIAAKADAFQRLLDRDGIHPFPGSVELIRALAARLPVGLCSGALQSDVEPVLERLGIREAFTVVVTADDVPTSKPDPACYRLCLHRLAEALQRAPFEPDRCVAIEDTPAGIQAASGAGLRVLAVTNSYSPDRLPGAHRVVNSLEGVHAAALSELTNDAKSPGPQDTRRRDEPSRSWG